MDLIWLYTYVKTACRYLHVCKVDCYTCPPMPNPRLVHADPTESQNKILKDAWTKLRMGHFDELQDLADELRGSLKSRSLSTTEALLGRCVACEIYDYYCRYPDAEQIVKTQAEEFMNNWSQGTIETDPWLLEQQVQTA